ncbi:MAG TPA: 6-pyruvoyl-tetrahydropterin synthase-related protein [Anaerolineae bacterium]
MPGRLPGEDAQARSAARPNRAALALLLLALIAAAPLWTGPGLVNTRSGGDSPFLFIRLHQLVENLRAGVFPARWMPDAAYGLGYPFFNFYAALPYYFAAIFNLLGFDLLASIKIVQSLGFVFAAWAMYGWVRSASGGAFYIQWGAWLAAVAYTFVPYHLVNVYVRGDSLSEFYAFVFYPLILWAIDRVIDRPRARSMVWLGLAYGGLILTHQISALIFTPFALLYIVIRGWKLGVGGWSDRLRHSAFCILHSAFAILLGLLVSAWFWLPALGEAPLVQLDAQTTGYFDYNEHFRSANLIQSSPGFDYNTEPPHTPFGMGLAQAIAMLAGIVSLLATRRRGSTGWRAFILIGLAVSTLMITPLSKPVWDALPLLPLVQFPWRFLSIQSLFASLAIGYLAAFNLTTRNTQYALRFTPWTTSLAGLALAAAALLPLRPDYLPIRADEITPQRIQLYEAFTTNIGTTIRAEYLPRTMIPRPYTGPALIDPAAPPRAILVRGEAEAVQDSRGPISQAWTVHASDNATLAFPTLYFPGWRASIDEKPVEARAAADLGYIEVDVPAGDHAIALWFDRTLLRAGAETASLVAVVVVVGLLVGRRRKTKDEGRDSHPSFVLRLWSFVTSRRYEIGLLASAGVLAVIASASNTVEARDDTLSMDFESKPWPHHGAVDLGAARLIQYEYADSLTPGEPFTAKLFWDSLHVSDAVATVEIVAPSQHAFGEPESIASASAPIREGENTYTRAIPASLSRGTYYLRVVVADALGTSRAVFLKPVFCAGSTVTASASTWARIADQIELKAVTLKHDQPDRLTLAFDWTALKPIAANYAVSLRLQDATGRMWLSFDTQPGYGFLPTSAWRPGELQHDVYTLALPPELPRGVVYTLDVVWYRVASQVEIGRVRVPGIEIGSTYGEKEIKPPPRNFIAPPMQHRVDATFGDAIRLLGYDLMQDGNRLMLTLHWQALIDIGTDYRFFVHVFDPATEAIAAQVDTMPGGNAYPTSRWVKGEVVSESVELELESGVYRVATGWYDPNSQDRLSAFDTVGHRYAEDRAILGRDIRIP